MKNINKLFLILFFLMIVFLSPKDVSAALNWSTQDKATYQDVNGKREYTYELAINITENSKVNQIEGYLKLTNLELVSVEGLNEFKLETASNSINFKLTSNHLYTSKEGRVKFVKVVVRRIDSTKNCTFGYDLTPRVVTTNSFNITKEAIKNGRVIKEVKEKDVFQYKITVKSNNNVLNTDPVTVTDTIPDYLEIINISDGGVKNNQTITWNLGVFNKGVNIKVLTVDVKAKEGSKGKVKNTAVLKVDDKTFQDDVDVNIVYSKIEIEKDVSQDKVIVGQEFYYIIKVKNVGTGVSDKVTVNDVLNNNLEFISSENNHACFNNNCTFDLDTIKSGETKTIKIKVKVKAGTPDGEIPNTATATEKGKNPVSDDEPVEVVSEKIEPDVTIKKSVNTTVVKPDEEFKYEIIVTNNNSLNLSDVIIKDVLDDNLIIVNASGAAIDKNILTWNISLVSNETKKIVITVKVKKDTKADKIKNKASIILDEKETPSNEVTVTVKKEKPKEDEIVNNKPDDKNKNDIENPKTGEVISYVGLGLGSIIGIGIFYHIKKKNKVYRI